jgi:hypothetical protein
MNSDEKIDAEEAAKLLTFIDTQEIDELDPNQEQFHNIPIELDIPMEVGLLEDRSSASNEILHIRVLVKGDDQDPQSVRVDLTSEDDIFFHYVCE